MSDYDYVGIPLNSSITSFIIESELAGQTLRRVEISRFVREHHQVNGGLTGVQTVDQIVKKSLHGLSKKGLVKNPTQGFWIIGSILVEPSPPDEVARPEQPEISPLLSIQALETIGEGSNAVYVYYLPMYKVAAQKAGKDIWACKVGRTDGDPLGRILTQAATALPERPVIALIINTHSSSDLEKALHATLSLRGRRISDVPGTEWFNTSPAEIKAIFGYITSVQII
jgi:T5orf172 domain